VVPPSPSRAWELLGLLQDAPRGVSAGPAVLEQVFTGLDAVLAFRDRAKSIMSECVLLMDLL